MLRVLAGLAVRCHRPLDAFANGARRRCRPAADPDEAVSDHGRRCGEVGRVAGHGSRVRLARPNARRGHLSVLRAFPGLAACCHRQVGARSTGARRRRRTPTRIVGGMRGRPPALGPKANGPVGDHPGRYGARVVSLVRQGHPSCEVLAPPDLQHRANRDVLGGSRRRPPDVHPVVAGHVDDDPFGLAIDAQRFAEAVERPAIGSSVRAAVDPDDGSADPIAAKFLDRSSWRDSDPRVVLVPSSALSPRTRRSGRRG